ncbi:MAG TPA: AbrB/MazE/SpoVT family DNA-binding domain-containing protein [Thermoanaerobaculia bacterium]|jgi:bifunctional DNA-binding transcriptional regulator/antitoxin component of YhaV-PrlF toxin-antitoxin module|nr:AbrB/MazE/SpoVT family DNA-binding domain-containing protein [Thermoanaerobaculia bacterium]
MSNLVGEKGQVVIQKPLREALGIQPGFVTVQTLVNDHVEIRFYPPEHTRSLRGALKKYATQTLSTGELREAREKAWDEAVTVDWNGEGKER